MPNEATPAPAPADAAPAPAVTPVATGGENGPAPSPAPAAEEEAYNPFAILSQLGSKVDAVGNTIDPVSLDTPIPQPEPDPAPEPEPTPAPPAPADDDEDDSPAPATAPRDPNNLRVNLKGAADADAKRNFLNILRREPGVTMEEAARRAGVKPAEAAATAAAEAPPAPDPVATLESEISALEAEEEAAGKEFDYDKQGTLNRQIRAKMRELSKVQLERTREGTVKAVEENAKAQTAQQQFEADNLATWGKVAESFPDVSQEGSDSHTAFSEAIAVIHETNPAFFKDPAWPAKLQESLVLTGKIVPKAPAANAPAPAAPPTPAKPTPAAPAVVPRKPSVPVSRPAPAPGGTQADSAAPVYQSGVTDPFEILRKFGTTVGVAG